MRRPSPRAPRVKFARNPRRQMNGERTDCFFRRRGGTRARLSTAGTGFLENSSSNSSPTALCAARAPLFENKLRLACQLIPPEQVTAVTGEISRVVFCSGLIGSGRSTCSRWNIRQVSKYRIFIANCLLVSLFTRCFGACADEVRLCVLRDFFNEHFVQQ